MPPTEIPLYPPRDWFAPPASMPKDAGCIVEPGGRVYGYLAHWASILMDGTSDRWKAPRSKNGYAFAHTGDTQLADGSILKTANLGGDFGHAPQGGGDLAATQAFYENTQTQLARIRYGEDEHGVWFAGCCWPTVSELDIAKLRASARSGHWAAVGDWRDLQSGRAGYELVGACLVNVPGLKYARADRAASGVLTFNPVNMASGADHAGAMCALFLEPELATALAVDGGEPATDLHITLAYFDQSGDDRGDWDAIHDLVRNVGEKHLPLAGKVQGKGMFYTDDGGVVHWASPDVPGLAALRTELVDALNLAGFDVRADHDFTPHVTLLYDPNDELPAPAVGKHDLVFEQITLAIGGDMTNLATTAAPMRIERVASSGTALLAADDAEVSEAAPDVRVGGVLLVEGVPTEDGRLIEAGAAEWRDLPLPLYSSLLNLPGHDSAALIGRIDAISRDADNPDVILWEGAVVPGLADGGGQATVDAITAKALRGISIDGIVGPNDSFWNEDEVNVMSRIVVAGATLTPMPAIHDATVTLLSATTETQMECGMEDEVVTTDEAAADDVAVVVEPDADQLSALADQVAALADRVEFLIGLVESWQMSARYEAAAAKPDRENMLAIAGRVRLKS